MRPNRVGWALVAGFLIGGVVLAVWIPEVWIGQAWIAVAIAMAAYYLLMNRRADRADRLKREGIPGRARIVEMTQTGMYVNSQPRVRLKLLIQAPGVAEFEAEDTYTVPLIALGALTSGGTLPVYLDRVDPVRPKNVEHRIACLRARVQIERRPGGGREERLRDTAAPAAEPVDRES